MTGRHWRPDEIQVLTDGYASGMSRFELTKRLGRSWDTIYEKARALELKRPEARLPPWTDVETAYVAGIIDGEGSILMYTRGNGAIRVILSVSNTNRELLDWLSFMFGMRPEQIVVRPSKSHRKTTFQLNVQTGPKVHAILVQLEPYLKVKRKQAGLLIGYCEWREALGRRDSRKRFSQAERSYAELMVRQVRLLNRRGVP